MNLTMLLSGVYHINMTVYLFRRVLLSQAEVFPSGGQRTDKKTLMNLVNQPQRSFLMMLDNVGIVVAPVFSK